MRSESGAVPAEQSEALNRELIHAFWSTQTTSQQTASQVTDWSVDRIGPTEWEISLIGPQTAQLGPIFDDAIGRFKSSLASWDDRDRRRTESQEGLIDANLSRVENAIARASEQATALESKVDSEASADDIQRGWRIVEQSLKDYEDARQNLITAINERDRISAAPMPIAALISPDTRRAAYEECVPLTEDIAHLDLQTRQLVSECLAARPAIDASITKLSRTAADLAAASTWSEAKSISNPMRASLEEVAAECRGFVRLCDDFKDGWNQALDRLQSAGSRSDGEAALDAYRLLDERLNNLLTAASDDLNNVEAQLGAANTMLASEAQLHALHTRLNHTRLELTQAMSELRLAQQDIQPQRNFVLDAALRSALGLRQRIHATRDEIDKSLEENAVEEARSLREEKLAALENRIAKLRASRETASDALIVALAACKAPTEQISALMNSVKDLGAATAERESLGEVRSMLAQLRDDLRSDNVAAHADWTTEVIPQPASRLPTNLSQILGIALLSWSGTLLLLLGGGYLSRQR